jgi:MarR family transcriptional regulator, organic hydroperoxide resistance regulator
MSTRTSPTFLLATLARRHRGHLTARLTELDLHAGSELMLVELWREDGVTQAELAARLGVRPPSVTKVLRGLVRRGLVERRSDPDDARVWRVHLTSAGSRMRQPVEHAWHEAERETLARLSQADARRLREVLARAVGRLP